MAGAEPRRAYQTLDGLRGVGAFLVVMRHVPDFFGPVRVPESFLAVDLFYLVSGFVVAHAYGARLRGGGFVWTFVKTRIIRLYPLYLFGLMLGLLAAVLSLFGHSAGGWTSWTWPRLAEAMIAGLFMIPQVPGLAANGSTLDGPTWTLLPELIANFVYAAAARLMTTAVLITIMIVCGAALIFAEFHAGTLDVGYSSNDQWAALARVGFSFFAGVLVFRLVGDKPPIKNEWVAWALVAALTLALGCSPSDEATPWFELAVVLAGFPLLLVLASRFEPGALTGRVFSYIGLVSYGVYIVHQPIGNLLRETIERRLHLPGDLGALPYGAVFLAMLVALAGALDRYYDGPVRAVLRRWFLSDRVERARKSGLTDP
jgi:peptidoglycan/LPS O-acetylase OafA/YrhL